MLDAVLLDNVLEVPTRPDDRDGQHGLIERLLVEEADRVQAELGMLEQPARGQPADPAGADHQRRFAELSLAPRLELRPVERHPARGQVDGAER